MTAARRGSWLPLMLTDEGETVVGVTKSRGSGRGDLSGLVRSVVVWTVLLGLLGAAAGGLVGLRLGRSTVAKAAVLVNPLAGNPFNPGSRGEDLLNLQSEAALLVSDPVAARVAKAENSDLDPYLLLAGLSVDVPPNTQILNITYADASAEVAVRRAQDFAEAFLAFRAERTKTLLTGRIATIETELSNRNDELARLVTERQSTDSNTPRAALLNEQIRAVGAQIGELRTRLTDLSTGGSEPGLIITPASVETSRISLPLALALLGAALGIVLGLVVSMLRRHRRGVIHDESDIEACGLSVLARVPAEELDRAAAGDLAKLDEVEIGPGLKELRSRILATAERRPWALMLAGTAAQDELASAAATVTALAQSRLNTIVVDISGSSRGLSFDLDLTPGPGLLEALEGQRVEPLLVPVAPGLRVLRLGSGEGDPDALLSSDAVAGVLTTLRSMADLVVVVTSSLDGSRAEAWVRWVDSVLVEVPASDATREHVLAAVENLDSSKVHGALLVAGSRRRPGSRIQRKSATQLDEVSSTA